MKLPAPALAFVLVASCTGRRVNDGGISAPPTTSARATCAVAGLEAAHPLERVQLPAGCSVSGNGSAAAPQVIHSAEELTAALACGDAARPAVDLAAHDLAVVRYEMSPAHAGLEVLDDGTTVTFVTRFRPPCPQDPRPMPMTGTLAFTLPKGATRVYREANCTLPRQCP